MNLEPAPDSLTCAECGKPVAESGYLPALTVDAGTYRPVPDLAVCGACGFNELGFAGCAPDLGDVIGDESGDVDALLQIAVSDSGIDVLSAKE